jgi:hypothetical protein
MYVAAANGMDLRALSTNVDVRGAASWSTDGKWIVVAGSDRRGGQFKPPVEGSFARERLSRYLLARLSDGENKQNPDSHRKRDSRFKSADPSRVRDIRCNIAILTYGWKSVSRVMRC